MEYRFLGASGFRVPVLGFGTGTFGGKGPLFSAWGNTGAQLGAIGWMLMADHLNRLDAASAVMPPYPYYPYWNGSFAERNPPPVQALLSTHA